MLNIIVEPFQGLNDVKRTLLLLSTCLMTLLGVSYSAIPFLFNRPQFQCSNQNGLYNCTQKDACLEKELKFEYQYVFSSIPKQYELYCENKIIETNILSLIVLSHFAGTVFNVLMSGLGNSLRKVLFLLAMSSGIIGASIISLLFINGTMLICLILMIWAFCMEIILCYIHVLPSLAFKEVKQKVLGLQLLAWPAISIGIGIPFWFFEDWKYALVVTVGIPHLIIGYILIIKLERFIEGVSQPNPMVMQLLRESAKQKSGPTVKQLINSPHLINFVIFLTLYSCGYVSLFSATLYLNTISWNLYLNMLVVNIVQFAANYVGIYIVNNLDYKKFLKFIFITITTIYLLYSFLPQNIQFGIIILSKGLTDFIWLMLCIEMLRVFPPNYLPFVSASKGSFSLGVSSILPYVKYIMQGFGSSMFPISGLYYLMGCFLLPHLKSPQKQQTPQMIQMH